MSLEWPSQKPPSRPPQPPPFRHQPPMEEPPPPRALYKNKNTGLLTGVCAGIADFVGIHVGIIRLITVFLSFLLPLTWLIYVVMAFLLPVKPLPVQRTGIHLRQELDQIQAQLSKSERKLLNMEAYITSDEFEFQRKIDELKQQR